MKKVELLFPELCNIYGESYNVEYLRRCSDEIEVINTNHMDTPAFVNEDVDMIYLGCTTERKQEQIIGILSQYRDRIIELIDKGVIFLATGNAVEIFGNYIEDRCSRYIRFLLCEIHEQRPSQLPVHRHI